MPPSPAGRSMPPGRRNRSALVAAVLAAVATIAGCGSAPPHSVAAADRPATSTPSGPALRGGGVGRLVVAGHTPAADTASPTAPTAGRSRAGAHGSGPTAATRSGSPTSRSHGSPGSGLPPPGSGGPAWPGQDPTTGPPDLPTGDPAPTRVVTVGTESQLAAAIGNATPGTAIRLRAGTYSGALTIRRSGTRTAPITISPAGNGPVTLTAHLSMPPCSASSPDPNRTVRFEQGASYWTISHLDIVGGVFLAGEGAGPFQKWFGDLVKSGNWQARRAIPGHGTDDFAADAHAIAYSAGQINHTLVPSDGVKIIDNDISLKGIHSAMNRYGTIAGNTIHNIACGVGPGVWLGSISDGWTVAYNHIYAIAAGTEHFMYEGIRVGGGSSYNEVTHNYVEDLPGDARAFATDQDGSYNVFTYNTARGVAIGYNEEMSGWGNVWSHNFVADFRTAGFSLRMMDDKLTAPSMNSSSYRTRVTCNVVAGPGTALQIGAVKDGVFADNRFETVHLGKFVPSYWDGQGNVWNGGHAAPGAHPVSAATGC
ncbi:MAG TPA: hypothetical protein VFI30_00365 [Nocardioidaceae bacterium]|nr:hypothetical protein [Nocardioidaceae bacterium]